MSRPPDNPGNPRTVAINIRVTEEERERMHKRAEKAGMGLSEFLRELALRGKLPTSRRTRP